MRFPSWLKLLFAILVISLLFVYYYTICSVIKSEKKESYVPKTNKETGVLIRKISDEIGHGLYEIKIDDSTTVLLYRGVESCTMIKK